MTQQEIAANLAGTDKKPDWSFYVAWISLTSLCIPATFLLDLIILRTVTHFVGDFIYINGVRHITEDYLAFYPFMPIAGLLTGGGQYWLLRRVLPHMGLWVLATTAGWILGPLLIAMAISLQWMDELQIGLAFPLMGLSIGAGQWLLLRRRLPAAGWWIAANLLGWLLLLLGTDNNAIGQLGLLLVGFFPACATAAALALLMRRNPLAEA
jgi:hypothetical protein